MTKIFFLTLLLLLTFLTNQKGVTQKELENKMLEFNMSPLVSLLLIYDSLAANTPQL